MNIKLNLNELSLYQLVRLYRVLEFTYIMDTKEIMQFMIATYGAEKVIMEMAKIGKDE
jgi:hypothetical protein